MLQTLRAHGRGKVFDILLQELAIDPAAWLPTLLLVYRSHRPVLSLSSQTAAILRSLKDRGLRLGLVTDGLASAQRRKIDALGLDAYMVAISSTPQPVKPSPKPPP